jgi:hypothetical protein
MHHQCRDMSAAGFAGHHPEGCSLRLGGPFEFREQGIRQRPGRHHPPIRAPLLDRRRQHQLLGGRLTGGELDRCQVFGVGRVRQPVDRARPPGGQEGDAQVVQRRTATDAQVASGGVGGGPRGGGIGEQGDRGGALPPLPRLRVVHRRRAVCQGDGGARGGALDGGGGHGDSS